MKIHGPSSTTDDNTYDDINSTNYDDCFQKLECNDFALAIPTNIEPYTHKVIIRINKEFVIHSPIVKIICNENNYNSVGRSICGVNGNCICDNWSIAVCQKDDEGNCGSLSQTDIVI